MNIEELKNLNEKELGEKISELRKELIKINAQVAIGTQIKNPGQISQIKKTIARINTITNQRRSAKKDE